jgi:hypothetical protein
VGRAIGGAVEGGVVNVMYTAGGTPKRRARCGGCLLWSPTAVVRSQGRGRRQVPRRALLARALAMGAAASARRLHAVWRGVRAGAPSCGGSKALFLRGWRRGTGKRWWRGCGCSLMWEKTADWALVWRAPQLGFRFGAPLGSHRQGAVPFPKRVRGGGGLSQVGFTGNS